MKESVSLQEMSQQQPSWLGLSLQQPSLWQHVLRLQSMNLEKGGDKKFYVGQHRNETYSEVAKKVDFID